MERILAVGIECSYGAKKVLSGVDISVQAGQCVGIVGANGCGKSTLLNIMTGIRKPKKGELYFDGYKVDFWGSTGRKMFISYTGYVPQESNLIPELSVLDNLLLWYQDKRELEYTLNNGFLGAIGINQMLHLKAGKLSGGMKKRVSIGCALAGNPPILMLDEPDAALDLPGKEEIRRYLDMYRHCGGTVLVATHDEGDLDICDRVYALRNGKAMEIERTLRGNELLRYILN